MGNEDKFFGENWIDSWKELVKARQDYVDKITSPLVVNVNIYIDGNNLFLNLERDLETINNITSKYPIENKFFKFF